MPETGTFTAKPAGNIQHNAGDDALPATCRKLPDGSVVMPRFAILDECEFFDKERNQVVKMTPERLAKIADRINSRIKRTHDAVPIIPGHTVAGLPEERQPRIIGKGIDAAVEDFVNPVTKQPVVENGRVKKALYVTPIAEPGEYKTFRQLRRGRSVELWLDPEGDDIDPIALLGANTPRRDLGPHQFQLAPMPRGLHKFSERHSGSTSIHFELETEDEGDDMATEPAGGDAPGGDAQRQMTEFENSALGKRLQSIADSMEAYMPMLQQMFEMYEGGQGGDQGAQGAMPPGAPGAEGAVQGQPQPAGQPPMPAGSVGQPDDDLFAAPADAGHQGQPTALGSAGCASPGGSTNVTMPGTEHKRNMGSAGVPPAEPRHMPASHMSRDSETAIKLARAESNLMLALQRIAELEQKNLSSEIESQLRVIESEFEFDFQEEFQNMMKLQRAEDRAAHVQRIVTRFRRRADAPPGNGQFVVPTGAIQLSKSGGLMTPHQAQTEFGRQQLMAQQQAAQQAQQRGPAANLSDADIQRMAAAFHATPAGQPMKFQADASGFADAMTALNQWALQRQQAQQQQAQPNGTAVR